MTSTTVVRAALSLACMLLAGETLLLLFGAGDGYGYRGFTDKTRREMVLINSELGTNAVAVVVFLVCALLAWRRMPIGRWFYIIIILPLLTVLWWAVQCGCAPDYLFIPLPLVGLVVLWLHRRAASRSAGLNA